MVFIYVYKGIDKNDHWKVYPINNSNWVSLVNYYKMRFKFFKDSKRLVIV